LVPTMVAMAEVGPTMVVMAEVGPTMVEVIPVIVEAIMVMVDVGPAMVEVIPAIVEAIMVMVEVGPALVEEEVIPTMVEVIMVLVAAVVDGVHGVLVAATMENESNHKFSAKLIKNRFRINSFLAVSSFDYQFGLAIRRFEFW